MSSSLLPAPVLSHRFVRACRSACSYREQNEQAQLLAEVSHKCRAVEESEDWIIGAKAEKCKAVLALMRQLAEEPR